MATLDSRSAAPKLTEAPGEVPACRPRGPGRRLVLVPAGPPTTLGPLVDEYLGGRTARGEIAESTRKNFTHRLGSLARSHGVRPLGQLDRHAIERWQAEVFPSLKPGPRRSLLSTVKGFCRWLVAEGYLGSDPTAGVPRVRQPRRVPRALSAMAAGAVLAACGEDLRARAVIWLMLGCGLRACEVANLKMSDFDPVAGTLHVRGKFDNERLLPMPDQTAGALALYLEIGGWTSGPLIRNVWRNAGLTQHTVVKLAGEVMRRGGLKEGAYDGVSGHALRHTAASDILDTCGDLRVVQALLGHVFLASTEIYLRRANIDQLRSAMQGRNYPSAANSKVSGR